MARKMTAKEIKVKKQFKNRFDKVLDVYEARDFVEITGKIGGDTITYRVYDNGMVTER